MTTTPFDDSLESHTEKPLREVFVTFTDEYDPDRLDEDEDVEAAARPRPSLGHPAPTDYSELLPGETANEPTARDYERAYNSDLTLEEQMSQFLAEPWDEETDEEPPDGWPVVYNYAELERLKRSNPKAYEKYLSDLDTAAIEAAQKEAQESHILDC